MGVENSRESNKLNENKDNKVSSGENYDNKIKNMERRVRTLLRGCDLCQKSKVVNYRFLAYTLSFISLINLILSRYIKLYYFSIAVNKQSCCYTVCDFLVISLLTCGNKRNVPLSEGRPNTLFHH